MVTSAIFCSAGIKGGGIGFVTCGLVIAQRFYTLASLTSMITSEHPRRTSVFAAARRFVADHGANDNATGSATEAERFVLYNACATSWGVRFFGVVVTESLVITKFFRFLVVVPTVYGVFLTYFGHHI